jgi:hypothetical protein
VNSPEAPRYLDAVVDGHRVHRVAWTYRDPRRRMKRCAITSRGTPAAWMSRMGDERVQAQANDFYGGSITANLVGSFKGRPETLGW